MKKILMFIFMLLFGLSSINAITLNDSEAYYNFNFDSFLDSSENGNDATNFGTDNITGKLIDGRDFAGDSEKDYIDTNFKLNAGSNPFSVQGWFNADTIGASGSGIINSVENGARDGFVILISSSGQLSFNTYSTNTAVGIITDGTISTGVWYHFVATYDGSGIELFLNNVSVGTDTTASFSSHDNNNRIGEYIRSLESRYFDGKMDEFAFYNRVLTIDEISASYNNGIGFDPYKAIDPTLQFSNITANNITLISDTSYNDSILFGTEVLNISTNGLVNHSYSLNGGSLIQYATNTLSGSVNLNLSEDYYNISFCAENSETSVCSINYSLVVDRTAPILTLIGNLTGDTFFVNFSTIFEVNYSISGEDFCNMNITYLEANESDSNFFINCTDTQVFTRAGLYNGFITARDNAGNTITASVNGTINPLVNITFLDENSTIITDYEVTIFHPSGRSSIQNDSGTGSIFLSPVNEGELDLGLHILEFNKLGFEIINVTYNMTVTSGGDNVSYFVPGAKITVFLFDAIDFSAITNETTTIQIIGDTFSNIYQTNESIFNISESGMAAGTYTMIVNNPNYEVVTRGFEFSNQEIIQLAIYMTPTEVPAGETTADLLVLPVDQDQNNLKNIVVFQYIWDSSLGQYVQSNQKTSDFDGETVFKVFLDTKLYMFCAEFEGKLICERDKTISVSTEKVVIEIDTSTLTAAEKTDIYLVDFPFTLTNVTTTIGLDDFTSINYVWNNPSQNVEEYCLEVFKLIDGLNTLVGRPCSESHANGLSVIIPESEFLNSTYIANAIIKKDGLTRIIDTLKLNAENELQEALSIYGWAKLIILLLVGLVVGVALSKTVHNVDIAHYGLTFIVLGMFIFFPTSIPFEVVVITAMINYIAVKYVNSRDDIQNKATFNNLTLVLGMYVIMVFSLTIVLQDLDNRGILDDYGVNILDSTLVVSDSNLNVFIENSSIELNSKRLSSTNSVLDQLNFIFLKAIGFVNTFLDILSTIFNIPSTLYSLAGFTNELLNTFVKVLDWITTIIIIRVYFKDIFK